MQFYRDPQRPMHWKPPALRAPVLILTIAVCWGLIVTLEFLLWKSQQDGGLIFAPVINDLPLSRTFLYRYFPTIIAVLFSIYWAWIDLETKRLEPYYQLSKENGALGKDSLLLHYPFSFIPLAPFKAFRDRHWPVFWASFAVVLVTWGLVPTQAGIFSVRPITRSANVTFDISTNLMPIGEQATKLTFRFAQSTFGIATLSETLPPFMARNYTLAPFKRRGELEVGSKKGTYTAPTTMYTLDLECEDVSHKTGRNDTRFVYESKRGCTWSLGLTGNKTLGNNSNGEENYATVKEYEGMYVGYHNTGAADYYLSSSCPESENSTFYAAISKTKKQENDPPLEVTAVFCRPRYWRQEVSATVEINGTPLKLLPLGDRQPLEWNVFNNTNFEMIMSSGSAQIFTRGNSLPIYHLPTYWDTVLDSNLSYYSTLMPMVGMAMCTGTRSLEEYLDWQTLSKGYADAYRLLFARAMVDVLGSDAKYSGEAVGQQRITTEAVILEPVFVHIVVGFLSVVSVATIALLTLSFLRKRHLRTDPSTIASIMAMVADNEPLLADFSDLDRCDMDDMHKILGQKRYKLINDQMGTSLIEFIPGDPIDTEEPIVARVGRRRDSPSSVAKPVRPVEFSLWMAVPFVNLFLILAIALGIVYGKARVNGLKLLSSNNIVQNMLENYIPTAIATLIEPMWILINRLLCMLQPLEELQDCNAKAHRSIDTNYNSLPPQLVVFKALKSKHFVLAAVCAMALLANLLAVAFAGLFNQGTIDIQYATLFQQPYQMKFVSINESIGTDRSSSRSMVPKSGAWRGGDGQDFLLTAESIIARNTSLPAWTDDTKFYLPLFSENNKTNSLNITHFEAETKTFGAALNCEPLKIGDNFQAGFRVTNDIIFSLNMSIPRESRNVRCRSGEIPYGTIYRYGEMKLREGECVTTPNALEFVINLRAPENATEQETEACATSVVLGWGRTPPGLCPQRDLPSTKNTIFAHCQPKLLVGRAKINVGSDGRLQRAAEVIPLDGEVTDTIPNLFSNSPSNLIRQSNRFLFISTIILHNDSFASDYINYFTLRTSNVTGLLDPNQPIPSLDDILKSINKTYSKLFAIWLGANKKHLLVPAASETAVPLRGFRVEPERRLFLSKPMFIISEAILCTYVIVAIWVYARRPGQYLPRLPTSIASVIALFAASAAVEDMRGTSHLDKRGRSQHLDQLDARYGYGSFIGGGDGQVHIGIEKVPFVRSRRGTTWLERKVPLLRRSTTSTN
ncbi:hypothetical protein GQ44DRAFT_735638 [Phaeosphaeriaceae sp. PMI808]|nr:hypothetical protein GQ44DRAFT_735638 [Phaeosphaeriaceae sp. PMI808]